METEGAVTRKRSRMVPEQWCDIAYVRDAGVLKAEGAGPDVG